MTPALSRSTISPRGRIEPDRARLRLDLTHHDGPFEAGVVGDEPSQQHADE